MMISIEKNVGRPTWTVASRIAARRASRVRASRAARERCLTMFSTHDHRAVDDDPEVHRAQRQQVRGDAADA